MRNARPIRGAHRGLRYDASDMNKDVTLTPPAGLHTELLDDELLLYHEKKTRVISLNSTASMIWTLCDGNRSLAMIQELLVDAYPDAASRVPDEMMEAIELFIREGALSPTLRSSIEP